jgi:hypothetical protein
MSTKSTDIKLFKLVNKISDARVVNMGYVLHELEIARSNSEVVLNSSIVPIIKNTTSGDPVSDEYVSSGPASQANVFKKENKLSCHVDKISKTIRFPHISRYKLTKNYRGYGLSTQSMSSIVKILKNEYADYVVEPVSFTFDNQGDEADRSAFFAFMEKFGFWFKFDGDDNTKGILNIEKAEMLKLPPEKGGIQELELSAFIKGMFDERVRMHEEIGRIKTEFKEKNTVFKRFEKDQAITLMVNVIGGLILLLLAILFI